MLRNVILVIFHLTIISMCIDGILNSYCLCCLPAWITMFCCQEFIWEFVNTLRPRQNGRHFSDNNLKPIFLNENVWISIKISLKFVPRGPINNIPALVQIMVWRRPGDKPLSEPMMIRLLTHICVTRPQWVKLVNKCFLKFRISVQYDEHTWIYSFLLGIRETELSYTTLATMTLNVCRINICYLISYIFWVIFSTIATKKSISQLFSLLRYL